VDQDTDIGGPRDAFPATRRTAVVEAGSPDPQVRRRAFETLVASYWKPVYKYVRVKWNASNEAAKDSTQAFFARAMEKGFFDRYDPDKALFRTYLRTCLDGFLANERLAARRQKRGGGRVIQSLDFDHAEEEMRREPAAPDVNPDDYFHKEWVRSLFAMAVEELREDLSSRGKHVHLALFQQYDLMDPEGERPLSYQELADRHGISVTQVTNYLALARRRFRQIVLSNLEAMTGSEAEFKNEARQLLGVEL